MNVGEKAFAELFPDKLVPRIVIKYSGAFSDFNANVKYSHDWMEFRLSKKWKDIGEDLQIGVIQHLLARVHKLKRNTIQMDMYDQFIKNLSTYAKKTKSDPLLVASFHRVNEAYLEGMMDQPNLSWGQRSFRKLGSYEYASDSITMSTILMDEPELLDYVMYHELLHKKFKYVTKNNRSHHHTPEFKRWEKKFANSHIEKELEQFLVKQKMKKLFKFW